MVTIYNSELTKELVAGAKIQQSKELPPTQLADKVVPVMEVNPRLLIKPDIFGDATSAATGTFTIFTTPATGDFYMTSIQAGYIKDVLCDVASGGIYVTASIKGVTTALIAFPVITTTVQSASLFFNFAQPIKIDRYTNVTFSGTFGAGVLIRSGVVHGYRTD